MDKELRQLSLLKKRLKVSERCFEERKRNASYSEPVPSSIGIKLTNRCNLRCTHCFEWSKTGYHHKMNQEDKFGDVSIEKILDLLRFTEPTKAPLYLWGGEPTIYREWDELCNLICEYDRDVVICTNGIQLIKLSESLCKLGERVTLLFSIEGFVEQHDEIRGKGMYLQTIHALEFFAHLRDIGKYKGFLSVETVISDSLIPHLIDYCISYKEGLIDALYLNFPWFINQEIASSMDIFFDKNLKDTCCQQGGFTENYSWHSFDFRVSESYIAPLIKSIKVIDKEKYPFKIHFNPNLKGEQLESYLKGEDILNISDKICLSYSQRIDILPNGDICPCKKYPELTVGNLNNHNIRTLWNDANFKKFRESINNKLMPICSKCELFYAYNKQ